MKTPHATPFFLIALITVLFIFASVAGIFLYESLKRKKRCRQIKQQYKNIIGQVVEVVWGKECLVVAAGGTGWIIERIGHHYLNSNNFDFDESLIGKKVRILDITGEGYVSVELLLERPSCIRN